jgi:hypothetical protein
MVDVYMSRGWDTTIPDLCSDQGIIFNGGKRVLNKKA